MGGNHPTLEKGIKEVAARVFPQNDKPAANNQVGAANGTVVATLEDGWQGNRRHTLGIQLVGAAAAVASRPCVHRCRRIVGSATRNRPRGLCAGPAWQHEKCFRGAVTAWHQEHGTVPKVLEPAPIAAESTA
jgi:hypothetical protein